MLKRAVTALLVAVLMASCCSSAHACGDKLLVLGRGIRLEAFLGNRTVRIIAYQHAGTHAADLIADSEFQSALKKAGYQLRVVRDTEELEVALRLGKYDLLLSDIADAEAVEPALQSAVAAPALIPILYRPTKVELAPVEKRYHYVLKSSRKASGNIAILEQALETKLEAEAKQKRERHKSSGA